MNKSTVKDENKGLFFKYEEKEAKSIYGWLNSYPISKVSDIIGYFENYDPNAYIPFESHQTLIKAISDRFPRKDVVPMLDIIMSAKAYKLEEKEIKQKAKQKKNEKAP